MATTKRKYRRVSVIPTTWTNEDGKIVESEIRIEEHAGKYYLAVADPASGSYRADLSREVAAELVKSLFLHGPR